MMVEDRYNLDRIPDLWTVCNMCLRFSFLSIGLGCEPPIAGKLGESAILLQDHID